MVNNIVLDLERIFYIHLFIIYATLPILESVCINAKARIDVKRNKKKGPTQETKKTNVVVE